MPVGLMVGVFATATTAQATPSASDLQQQINTKSTQLEKIVEQYNKNNELLKASKAKSKALADKIAPLQNQVNAAGGDVGQLAASAYKTGNLSGLSAMLSGSADGSMLERLSILDQLSKSRNAKVSGFTAVKQQYETQKSVADQQAAQQAAQAKVLAAGKAKIEGDVANLLALRKQAYGSATTASTAYTGSIPAVSGKAGTAVRFAYNAIGAHYVFAAAGPYKSGFDCSGLTMAAWGAAGVTLPHNAEMQWYDSHMRSISRSQLAAGDLVFYNGLGHVAIYVGGGQVIHAPQEGENVKLASVDLLPPEHFGRVVG
jgi:cell wall-associated NlpC family hydrolase